MSRLLPEHATIIFDGTCGFCTRMVRLTRAIDARGRLEAVPCQRTDRVAALGVTTAECDASAWVVSDSGARFGGAQAVLAAVAIARGWPWLLSTGGLPVVRQVLAAGYHLVSRVRPWLPGDRPWCETHPDECRPGGDSAPG